MGSCLACLNSRERDEVALRFATTRAALNIKEPDFWRLYRVFKKANKSESGKMSYEEFVERIDVEAHGLSKRLYDLFCGHTPGGIGFKLFAILSWNLCTSDADSLSVFAFLCYDRRGEGRLDLLDVTTMCEEVFGGDYRQKSGPRAFEQELCELDITGKPKEADVDMPAFVKVFSKARVALFPVFEVQRAMQNHIMGLSFWMAETQKRKKLLATGKFQLKPLLDVLNEERAEDKRFVAYGREHFIPCKAVPRDTSIGAGMEEMLANAMARQAKNPAGGSPADTARSPLPSVSSARSPAATPASPASPASPGIASPRDTRTEATGVMASPPFSSPSGIAMEMVSPAATFVSPASPRGNGRRGEGRRGEDPTSPTPVLQLNLGGQYGGSPVGTPLNSIRSPGPGKQSNKVFPGAGELGGTGLNLNTSSGRQ